MCLWLQNGVVHLRIDGIVIVCGGEDSHADVRVEAWCDCCWQGPRRIVVDQGFVGKGLIFVCGALPAFGRCICSLCVRCASVALWFARCAVVVCSSVRSPQLYVCVFLLTF